MHVEVCLYANFSGYPTGIQITFKHFVTCTLSDPLSSFAVTCL